MRTLLRGLLLVGLITAARADTAAELNIYLHSMADYAEDGITLGAVAAFDGSPEEAEKAKALKIPALLVRDGYLDRKEIEGLLSGVMTGRVYIYGSAVRIIRAGAVETAEPVEVKRVSVKAGDPVAVRVRKKGILVEMTGSAVADCREGETVEVKLRGYRSLKGRLTSEGTVDLAL